MTDLAQRIVARLPYLRRFARALTGSQAVGDAYVTAALEAISENREPLPEDGDISLVLFGVFCRAWQTVSLNLDEDDAGLPESADQNLAALKPMERLVFLLRMLEGFSIEQTATILDRDVEEVEALMAEANADIAAQLSSKVLIIEDEAVTALDLSRLVTNLGHQVTSMARTRDEAVEAVASEQPGLVLADIQLADGSSGIDAANEIQRQFAVPVIFITGHPELLLTGQRPEPTFLIAKPYDPDVLAAMISQVLFFHPGSSDRAAA